MKTKKAECPGCFEELDGATAIKGQGAPNIGDVSICVYCGQVAIFEEGEQLRLPTEEELEALPAEIKNLARGKSFIPFIRVLTARRQIPSR